MNASSRSAANSRLSRATARVTVDRETSAPCSSLNRSQILVAVCRCLRQFARSSASHCSITGRYGSITDARGFLTDGTADRSSFARYLRTVGSLTCVFRAIDATDSPFRRKRRIDCTWGMLIIILSGPFWRRYKHHPVKTIPWSACSA
ncbi:hypothetical protein BIFLH277_01297 [Bifidobacterium longum subsp. longum]|nr:hypothetical protein BIFLH206_00358 [Bifidobacterium longum subsp. longum]VWQ36225.1 hypothetical protein BIFLH277_01297 [Bifidobacterium longum subsp. longum]